jgi:SAM-dependent MidA family methyltransferase
VAETVPWRAAMAESLYGAEGFFRRPGQVDRHFRTSATASPLFATAVLRLVAATDEALGRPAELDVVDIGAGGAHLLRRLAVLAPAYLASRLRLSAVEVGPRPADLPEAVAWHERLPSPASVTGVVLATEWLDNVPLDVAEVDDRAVPRYVLVDAAGTESPGSEVDGPDLTWALRWWDEPQWTPGDRIELGPARDEAWAAAVSAVSAGLAVAVDYGHLREARPRLGTLAGFRYGRAHAPVPDGLGDLTAHVAMDAVRAAGEAVAGRPAVLRPQAEALRALGLDARRPPLDQARTDPAGYVRALSAAGEAADLMDPAGLGAHLWLVQPVRVPDTVLPPDLRP